MASTIVNETQDTQTVARRIINARCDGLYTIITRDSGGNLVDSVTLDVCETTAKVLAAVATSELMISHGFTIEFE